MATGETISASMEDYLEAIFLALSEKGAARAKDIAHRLGVTSSSVTGALHTLSEKNLINYTPYELITLTEEGDRIAREIVRCHNALKDFLVRVLGVDENQAEDAACAMEHALPRGVLERLTRFVEFTEVCPRGTADWMGCFAAFCRRHEIAGDCETCIRNCLEQAKSRKP